MHNFILKCFGFFRSTMQFLKILCVFSILLILLYWIQNLIGSEWRWLGFARPFLDELINFSDKIFTGSLVLFGAVFEFKYAIAVIIMIILAVIINSIMQFSHEVQRIYHNSRLIFKKANENVFNKNLAKKVEKQEKKLQKYLVALKGRVKKKYSIEEFNVDIEEINKQINEFIIIQLGIRPTDYQFSREGEYYISEYKFDNFDNIDEVLSVLFMAKKAQKNVEYAICIQIEDFPVKLEKLVSLNNFNKITMGADTAFRYKFVQSAKYETSMVGVFQYNGQTLEVHEFQQNL